MMHSFLTAAVLAASTLTSIVSAVPLNARGVALPTSSSTPSCSNNGPYRSDAQIAVYYGQGPEQARLSTFCDQSQYDIIPVGFINGFGNGYTYDWGSNTFKYNYGWPSANFGNQCGSANYTLPNGTVTNMFLSCGQLAEDVQYCQNAGKKITLSIGGANDRSPYQLGSDDEGRDFAEKVWGMFGPKRADWGNKPRPFGDFVVDGIDLDLEMGSNVGYAAMATRFRELMGNSKLLTAAPQCGMPDSHLSDAFSAARFDHIYVQFYNTPSCSAAAGVSKLKGGNGGNDINFKAWADFANGLNQSPTPKVFIGLPGSTQAANNGYYISASDAKLLLDKYHKYPGFGGVMIWEATYAQTNPDGDYTKAIKKALDACYDGSTCTSTTTSSTSTTSSTTSTSTTTTTTSSSSSSTTTTSSTASVTSTSSTSSSSTSTVSSNTSSSSTTITTGTSSTSSTSSISSTSTSTSSSTVTSATSSSSSATTTETTSSTSKSFTFPHGPSGFTTTSTDVTTSSTSSFPHPPFGTSTTTSSDSTTKTSSDKSTSTSTKESTKSGKPTTSSEDHPWGQWTLTTSRSADPTTRSTEWSTWATTTSKPVDPASTWSQWSTTSKPVDPSSSTWVSWAGKSSVYVTTTTTVYVDVCPTGYITKTATLTATVTMTGVWSDSAASSSIFWGPPTAPKPTGNWPTNAGGLPSGFYTTETVCKSGCAATPVTVIVTIPVPTGPITKTVVPTPASPDAAVGTGKPGSPVAGIVSSVPSNWNTWALATGGLPVAGATGTSSASASTSTAWNTWATGTAGSPVAGATGASVSGVQGVKAYTGGAAAEQAPATAFSIAVCLALAIAGLVL